MKKILLKLYVAGNTPKSKVAIENMKKICSDNFPDQYELMIIDVLESPQIAEDEKILATPTLVRELPEPIRRITGDLSNLDQVLIGLDIKD